VWTRFRKVARTSPALIVRGMLERQQGVVNLLAHRIEALDLRPAALLRSRDFH
jgi:error-prone DNA polymerase